MAVDDIHDLLIIGGGINGAGVARDAAGRGLKVALIEAHDLGGGTSSASTKLVHGGLRYLEFGAFGLVRKSLAEREVILRAAPHISWPQSFLLPVEQGVRSRWTIGAGLFLYDRLARRREVPGSQSVALQKDAAGPAFQSRLTRAYRFWDGWVDDSRLVVLNARDAAKRGATILTRDGVKSAVRRGFGWEVETQSGRRFATRKLLNMAGPWAGQVAEQVLGVPDAPKLSLVQGAHIITKRVNRTADAWMLQQADGRIVFVIPYEKEFSLIGTTETPVSDPAARTPTEAEEAYLLAAVNHSLARPLEPKDIIHRFAGVRPLVLEEGKSPRETTRDWKLVPHGDDAMTVVGGKLTTYRVLAEAVLKAMFPDTRKWTSGTVLPGGDIPRLGGTARADYESWLANLKAGNGLYDPAIVERLARLFGTDAEAMLHTGLGRNLGGMFEAELQFMSAEEWATTAEDVLWRRTKMGLHLDAEAAGRVALFFGEVRRGSAPAPRQGNDFPVPS